MQNFSFFKTALVFFTLLALVQACSRCKENEPVVRCGEGYTIVNDQCVCPTGGIEANGNCYVLGNNEYFGVTDCSCDDSIYINILETRQNWQTGAWEAQVDLDIRNNAQTSTIFEYYELPDGDSLRIEYFPSLFPGFSFTPCPIGFREARIKKIGTDTLRLKFVYFRFIDDIRYDIDSCVTYLTR